jgi:hypothetical protein
VLHLPFYFSLFNYGGGGSTGGSTHASVFTNNSSSLLKTVVPSGFVPETVTVSVTLVKSPLVVYVRATVDDAPTANVVGIVGELSDPPPS